MTAANRRASIRHLYSVSGGLCIPEWRASQSLPFSILGFICSIIINLQIFTVMNLPIMMMSITKVRVVHFICCIYVSGICKTDDHPCRASTHYSTIYKGRSRPPAVNSALAKSNNPIRRALDVARIVRCFPCWDLETPPINQAFAKLSALARRPIDYTSDQPAKVSKNSPRYLMRLSPLDVGQS
jgi:hypothetical protein